MIRSSIAAAVVGTLIASGAGGGDTARSGAAIAPTMPCAALPGHGSIVDTAVPVVAGGRPYCDVHGVMAPDTHFEIMLPIIGWRGQYLQEGCGGLCGASGLSTLPPVGYACQPALDGRLVLAADDGGHTASDYTDGRWAENRPDLRVVFGITSEHSLRQSSAAIISRFYGRPPADTYFDGCSTGGR